MPAAASRVLPVIVAIARNTFREAIRDRVLYLLLAFAVLVIAVSRLVALMTVGSEEKIVKDLGLSAISLFGVLTAMFVGVSLVWKEIDKRTILTLLANPVRRWEFLLGKYAGLLAVLALNVLSMSVALLAMLWMRGATGAGLLPAIGLTFVELAVVTSFAILFSTFTNPILAALGTFSIYVVGHLVWSLEQLAERLPSGAGRTLCEGLGYLLPNLDRLNVRPESVHGIALPDGYVLTGLVYGTSYAIAVLALACLVFERREFH